MLLTPARVVPAARGATPSGVRRAPWFDRSFEMAAKDKGGPPHPNGSATSGPGRRGSPLKRPVFTGYVVAIGASAGGLDALERFFDELPADTGAAFVVIQHLSPDHKSMMDNLLARHTDMPVLMAENGMELAANHVYLIPPGKNMTVAGSQLRLMPKNPHGLSLPIDLFFGSLAQEFGRRAVGTILSATGSDGTRGAVAINDAGGFLLAQDPDSAKFDGMPRSVIATGLVDEVLPAGTSRRPDPVPIGRYVLRRQHSSQQPTGPVVSASRRGSISSRNFVMNVFLDPRFTLGRRRSAGHPEWQCGIQRLPTAEIGG